LGGVFAQLAYIENILIDQTFDVEKSKQVGDGAKRRRPLVAYYNTALPYTAQPTVNLSHNSRERDRAAAFSRLNFSSHTNDICKSFGSSVIFETWSIREGFT
jgi:hypothetical protein